MVQFKVFCIHHQKGLCTFFFIFGYTNNLKKKRVLKFLVIIPVIVSFSLHYSNVFYFLKKSSKVNVQIIESRKIDKKKLEQNAFRTKFDNTKRVVCFIVGTFCTRLGVIIQTIILNLLSDYFKILYCLTVKYI